MKLPVLGHALNPGFFRKLGGRLENAFLNKMGLDVLGHSLGGIRLFTVRRILLSSGRDGKKKPFLMLSPAPLSDKWKRNRSS
jgi:hypothetical protein